MPASFAINKPIQTAAIDILVEVQIPPFLARVLLQPIDEVIHIN